jgi:hypothetical protein
VDLVTLGEFGVAGRMFEVPHKRRGVEEVDGSYAYGIGDVRTQEISLCDAGTEREFLHSCIMACGTVQRG